LTAERDLTYEELIRIKDKVSADCATKLGTDKVCADFAPTKLGAIAKFRAHIHAKSFLGCGLFALEKDLEGGRVTGPLLDSPEGQRAWQLGEEPRARRV
jgi:hypothetical protein